MIIYPLSIPASPPARSIRFAPRFAVAKTESPFTFEEEIFEHMGQQMTIQVDLPPMFRLAAEQWIGWSLALNGSVGTFLFGDPLAALPMGTGNGAPNTMGIQKARAKILKTDGWTIGETVLRSGDYIELPGNRLHKVMIDAVADIMGDAEVNIFPRLRHDVPSGTPLILNNTKGIWRLSEPVSWDVGEAEIYGLSFSAYEVI